MRRGRVLCLRRCNRRKDPGRVKDGGNRGTRLLCAASAERPFQRNQAFGALRLLNGALAENRASDSDPRNAEASLGRCISQRH